LSKNYNDIPAYISLFFNDIQRNKLYKPEFYEKAITKKAESYKLDLLENCYSEDIVTTLQEVDIRTYLVDDILTKVDRASMSNSIEVRVPLLDHELAELTFQMPVEKGLVFL
jgi:asparagine synthase (glutamine-hydrolysing)